MKPPKGPSGPCTMTLSVPLLPVGGSSPNRSVPMSIRSTSLFDTGTRAEPFLVLFTTLCLSTLSSILSRKDLEGAPSLVIWE